MSSRLILGVMLATFKSMHQITTKCSICIVAGCRLTYGFFTVPKVYLLRRKNSAKRSLKWQNFARKNLSALSGITFSYPGSSSKGLKDLKICRE